jgi:hypothetical protein
MSNEKHAAQGHIGVFASSMPSMKKKLVIWAVRSVIAVALAYGIVALNGPGWLIPAAWIYVGVSLLTSVGMVLYAQRLMSRAQARAEAAADAAQD